MKKTVIMRGEDIVYESRVPLVFWYVVITLIAFIFGFFIAMRQYHYENITNNAMVNSLSDAGGFIQQGVDTGYTGQEGRIYLSCNGSLLNKDVVYNVTFFYPPGCPVHLINNSFDQK